MEISSQREHEIGECILKSEAATELFSLLQSRSPAALSRPLTSMEMDRRLDEAQRGSQVGPPQTAAGLSLKRERGEGTDLELSKAPSLGAVGR